MPAPGKKIAVIGSGIAGLVAARRLDDRHQVVLFEASDRPGGHTRTLTVDHEGRRIAVDLGFIVFNDRTYPNFIALLHELDVITQPSQMTFSVRDDTRGMEYQGAGLNGLFAQRSNLLRPAFLHMLRDIARFFRDGRDALDTLAADVTLGEFLAARGYGRDLIERFVVPMGAAIWSTDPVRMLAFPAASFLCFFNNHGLLQLRDRPQWRVLSGGSRTYVDRLLAELRGEIRLSVPVQHVVRKPDCVFVHTGDAAPERFDYVIFACHSDQILDLVAEAGATERAVLSALPYQENEVVLHTDTRMLPLRRRAWSAWNYRLQAGAAGRATLTYNMNILQSHGCRTPLCVTLNGRAQIDPARIFLVTSMAHPLFTVEGIAAQKRIAALQGHQRSFYCGAWCGYGFHEDGVVSAIRATDALLQQVRDEELPLQRAN